MHVKHYKKDNNIKQKNLTITWQPPPPPPPFFLTPSFSSKNFQTPPPFPSILKKMNPPEL